MEETESTFFRRFRLTWIEIFLRNFQVDLRVGYSSPRQMKLYRRFQVVDIQNHPCRLDRGGCEQFCIPLGASERSCGCGVGFTLVAETRCRNFETFAIISQLSLIRGIDITSNRTEIAMTPISGPGSLSEKTFSRFPFTILHFILEAKIFMFCFVLRFFFLPERNALHVDFHYQERWVYWTDFNKDRSPDLPNGIFRVHPDGSGFQQIISTGVGITGIRGLAVDWVAGNVYFTNVFATDTFVEVCRLDGKFRKVLFKTDRDSPRQVNQSINQWLSCRVGCVGCVGVGHTVAIATVFEPSQCAVK